MTSVLAPHYHCADWLYPGDGQPLRNGWIRVEGGRITETGTGALPADAAKTEHAGAALLPGLVNAHCHLELTTLHDRLDREKPFPTWVEQLRGYTAGLDAAAYRRAAREGVRRLLAGGCTTVLDVGNTGEALGVLADPAASPLRAFACVETLGLDPALAETRYAAAAARAGATPSTDRVRPGVAPHAAYSTSKELFRMLVDHQRARGLPVTVHLSESREEAELFASGSGPLADYCRRIYVGAPWHRGYTPVRWLEREGLLPDGAVVVHGNMLDDADMDILARGGATVVHCPSSHAFFRHPRFPYAALRARGVNVALGTDSLASADSLSMLEQLRLFRAQYPEVSLPEALELATVNGARALGLADVGLLKPGYQADFTVAACDAEGNPVDATGNARCSYIGGASTVSGFFPA